LRTAESRVEGRERFHRGKEGTQRTQRGRKIFSASFVNSNNGFLCDLFYLCVLCGNVTPLPKDRLSGFLPERG
jgi:hypothetical protein